ncbi:LacI family DNA-binding transcriptional regulator [Aurantimonas sp. VKM B-3413]|uniref:LacI family DNA-binding transcriptional regulator n=1 Tax=Aurantimonas sp. VKM B-3413 TaxID=2779401 RepID=UPI001E5248A1|nr:LacI family DNA-binding transcriptional regulator [Aurantimonas sp. VKM B-3413]MCB8836229.1 LacI family DNA-binding transcriptional regulator [Aurantimonas sp. VKM B-3413]
MTQAQPGDRMKRPTLLDVAEHAGVSRATASLVVRKSPLVSVKTRERVEAAMAELGYVYNAGAARMRAARSRTVGVVVPNLTNPFFAVLLAGMEAVFETEGLAVIFANSNESLAKQTGFLTRMREHGADGVIVCPCEGTDHRLVDDTARWDLPLVQALRYLPETVTDYAGIDYREGMRDATERLIALGHRRILFVSGNRRHSAQLDRLEGFGAAMRAHDLDAGNVAELPLTHAAARQAALAIAAAKDRPTAVICFNDVVALGLHRGFFDLGLRVGRDVSLVGFDNVAEAALVVPGLASVGTMPFEVGENAARLLLRRIGEPEAPVERWVAATEFVMRESLGPTEPALDRQSALL